MNYMMLFQELHLKLFLSLLNILTFQLTVSVSGHCTSLSESTSKDQPPFHDFLKCVGINTWSLGIASSLPGVKLQ